jgi:hypothetical protein
LFFVVPRYRFCPSTKAQFFISSFIHPLYQKYKKYLDVCLCGWGYGKSDRLTVCYNIFRFLDSPKIKLTEISFRRNIMSGTNTPAGGSPGSAPGGQTGGGSQGQGNGNGR